MQKILHAPVKLDTTYSNQEAKRQPAQARRRAGQHGQQLLGGAEEQNLGRRPKGSKR